MKRVLIIKLWALGDIVMATPLLDALKAQWPDVQITWVADTAHADVLRGHPLIHQLVPLDTRGWRRRLRKGNVIGWLARAVHLHRQMLASRFDAVLNCHPDKAWTRILCAAPVRVGLWPDVPRDTGRFYTYALGRPPGLHNTQHYLTMTQALGVPDAGYQTSVGQASRLMGEEGLETGGILLAPFSTGENRVWEPERWALLAAWLHETYHVRIFLTGGQGDREKAQAIADASGVPVIVAAGRTVAEYVTLVRQCRLVVSGDTSAMHLAAACGVPYVALFGPTPIAERAPLVGVGTVVACPTPCAPCDLPTCANAVFRLCMKQIALADVQAAIGMYLENTAPSSAAQRQADGTGRFQADETGRFRHTPHREGGRTLPVKRVLIVKFWALGDILMATPLLRALKTRWPDSHIAWLVDEQFADILRGNPLIDDVIAFPSGAWRRDWRYGRLVPYLKRSLVLHRQLKASRYDILIGLTAEKWWAAWFLTASIRIGLFPRAHPGLMGRLYTHAIPRTYDPVLHNTRHYLLPADALGILGPHSERMVLSVRDEDRRSADAFLASQAGFDPMRPLYVLHPGTSQRSKCWLPEYYAVLARELAMRGANVVLTGSADERGLCERIAAEAPAVLVAAGHLPSLLSTAALVEKAAAVVTGDTSLLHIASALNVPLVGIYGSTRPNDNAPLFGPQALLYDTAVSCSPCYKAHCPLTGNAHMQCQRAVTPQMVLDALDKLTRSDRVQSGP